MFGLGFLEIIFILTIILLVVGPDRLPEMARKLGRATWKLRRTADEFKREIALPTLDNLGVDAQFFRRDYDPFRGIAEDCPDNTANQESLEYQDDSGTSETCESGCSHEPSEPAEVETTDTKTTESDSAAEETAKETTS